MLTNGILTFRVDDIVQSFGKGTHLSSTYLYLKFLHDLMRGMLQRDKKTRMESRHSGSATCRSRRPPVIERDYLPVTRAGFLSLPTRRWCCYHCSNYFPRDILQDEGTLFSPGNSFCGECRDCYIQPAIAVELHL